MRLVVLMLLVGCAASAPRPVDPQRRLVHFFDDCGMGWRAAPDLIVTNRHVADCLLQRAPGKLGMGDRRGHVVRRGTGYVDLAVVRLTRPLDGPPAVRSRRPVAVGDQLFGYAMRRAPYRTYVPPSYQPWDLTPYRVVARPEQLDGGLDGVIVVEGQAHRGQSGGPAFDRDGRVVGTFYAATRTHAFIVPVVPYLDELLSSGEVARPPARPAAPPPRAPSASAPVAPPAR